MVYWLILLLFLRVAFDVLFVQSDRQMIDRLKSRHESDNKLIAQIQARRNDLIVTLYPTCLTICTH
jgi:ABC-type enterochelin transport system substrate-binding protein